MRAVRASSASRPPVFYGRRGAGPSCPTWLQTGMIIMLEVVDSAEAVQAWATCRDDDEGYGVEDELFHAGEVAAARVAEAARMEVISGPWF